MTRNHQKPSDGVNKNNPKKKQQKKKNKAKKIAKKHGADGNIILFLFYLGTKYITMERRKNINAKLF